MNPATITYQGTILSVTATPYWFTCLVIHDTARDVAVMRYSDDVTNLSEPDERFNIGDAVEYYPHGDR